MWSSTFVGRSAELAGLEAALEDAIERRPCLVFVAGDSGVGKTRMLSEFAARARDRGARVLSGDCIELGEGELPCANSGRPAHRWHAIAIRCSRRSSYSRDPSWRRSCRSWETVPVAGAAPNRRMTPPRLACSRRYCGCWSGSAMPLERCSRSRIFTGRTGRRELFWCSSSATSAPSGCSSSRRTGRTSCTAATRSARCWPSSSV